MSTATSHTASDATKCPRGLCPAKKSSFCMQRKWCMPEKHGTPELDLAALQAYRSESEYEQELLRYGRLPPP